MPEPGQFDHDQKSSRELARTALKTADDAGRLALAASHQVELLDQRMDHFEAMDLERRNNMLAALARIEKGVAGLYAKGWTFVLTITGGLLGAAGIIAAVAFAIGKVGGMK